MLDAWEERECTCACPINAAIVDKYCACVRRKASINSSYVEGPEGKGGDEKLVTESADVKEEEEDMLLIE